MNKIENWLESKPAQFSLVNSNLVGSGLAGCGASSPEGVGGASFFLPQRPNQLEMSLEASGASLLYVYRFAASARGSILFFLVPFFCLFAEPEKKLFSHTLSFQRTKSQPKPAPLFFYFVAFDKK
jgi:hypothetical protein